MQPGIEFMMFYRDRQGAQPVHVTVVAAREIMDGYFTRVLRSSRQ